MTELRAPAPLAIASALLPIFLLWMLPQTLIGCIIALHRWTRGHPMQLVRFGPFLAALVPAPGPGTAGISLGLIVFAEHPSIIRHELCHIVTGLWLGWLYLPVYGLEYLVLGHQRSFHERLTCWFEHNLSWQLHLARDVRA